jgi:hypothetical protein
VVREPGQHSPQPKKLRTGRPKRLHARFPFAAQLEVRRLSAADKPRPILEVLRGKTENISTGGLCVRAKHPLRSSDLVRCEIRLPGVPARIPFLAQVRWIEKRSGANPYRVGLKFLV